MIIDLVILVIEIQTMVVMAVSRLILVKVFITIQLVEHLVTMIQVVVMMLHVVLIVKSLS